jgi:hypothetical protein
MMIPGELNFNDVMYSSDHEAYYKLGYIMYILFTICMTIITVNLLIGMIFFNDRIYYLFSL